jgi:hypothetical protein
VEELFFWTPSLNHLCSWTLSGICREFVGIFGLCREFIGHGAEVHKWFLKRFLGHFFLKNHLQNHLCACAWVLGLFLEFSGNCRDLSGFVGNFLDMAPRHTSGFIKVSWTFLCGKPLAKPLVCLCLGSWTFSWIFGELSGFVGNFLDMAPRYTSGLRKSFLFPLAHHLLTSYHHSF